MPLAAGLQSGECVVTADRFDRLDLLVGLVGGATGGGKVVQRLEIEPELCVHSGKRPLESQCGVGCHRALAVTNLVKPGSGEPRRLSQTVVAEPHRFDEIEMKDIPRMGILGEFWTGVHGRGG